MVRIPKENLAKKEEPNVQGLFSNEMDMPR